MLFMDSSFILALFNDNDRNHRNALKLLDLIPDIKKEKKVINNIVFLEVINKLKKSYFKKNREEIIDFLLNIDIFYFIDDEDYFDAVELTRYYNYSVNYSDCLILITMNKQGINKIISFDDDFEKVKGIETIYFKQE